TISRVRKEEPVVYIAEIIAARFSLRAIDLLTHKPIEIRGGMVAAVVCRRSQPLTLLKDGHLLDHGTAAKIGAALDAFGRAAAAINLAATLHVFYTDPTLKNSISAIGAMAEMLHSVKSVDAFINN